MDLLNLKINSIVKFQINLNLFDFKCSNFIKSNQHFSYQDYHLYLLVKSNLLKFTLQPIQSYFYK